MWQQKFLCVCITFYLILFYSGNPFENCWQIHNNCLLLYARGCVCVCDVMPLCVGVFGKFVVSVVVVVAVIFVAGLALYSNK